MEPIIIIDEKKAFTAEELKHWVELAYKQGYTDGCASWGGGVTAYASSVCNISSERSVTNG